MINKCSYCRKDDCKKKIDMKVFLSGRHEELELRYCSPECRERIEKFALFNNEKGPKFMVLILLWVVFFGVLPFILKAVSGNVLFIEVGMPAMLALMGVILAIYPIAIGPRLWYRKLGIKYTTLFIRITGVLMVITGVHMLLVRFVF